MTIYTDPEAQKQYDDAMAKLDAEASRDDAGKFTKAEPEPVTEPAVEAAPEVKPEVAVEPKAEPAAPEPDPLAEIKAELEKAKKQAADNKAWATKVAQELAEAKRERERQAREASKPPVLEQHPELEEAIRYVADAPKPVQADPQQEWMKVIESAHPGIFAPDADPELVNALVAKRDASNGAWFADPLQAIREINEEKLAHAERQLTKRLEVERQKASAKSAMSVPGAGAGAPVKATDPVADEVKRIQSMSAAEFERERRRVLGL